MYGERTDGMVAIAESFAKNPSQEKKQIFCDQADSPRNPDDFEAQQPSQIWLEAKSSHKISASFPITDSIACPTNGSHPIHLLA